VIQEKEVERLGSQKKINLNVRILAATNQSLKDRLQQGRFREDLYYRLNVFPVHLPALRERPGDILPLAREFVRRHSPHGKNLPDFDAAATQKMRLYDWPGNVRELENVVQRALILCAGGVITNNDLLFEDAISLSCNRLRLVSGERMEAVEMADENDDCSGLDESLRCAEENIILQTLQIEKGSRKTTAEKLGISPRTLRYKMARMKEAGIILPC
jgi:two-component system response regulator FlrC